MILFFFWRKKKVKELESIIPKHFMIGIEMTAILGNKNRNRKIEANN